MWRLPTDPQRNQTIRLSFQPHPFLYSSAPRMLRGGLKLQTPPHEKVRRCQTSVPPPLWPRRIADTKGQNWFYVDWFHPCRGSPALHHEQLGKDSGTLTGLHLINPAFLLATVERCTRCDFLFRTSVGRYTAMLNFFPIIPHGWFLRMS